jgi:hypothetical protein
LKIFRLRAFLNNKLLLFGGIFSICNFSLFILPHTKRSVLEREVAEKCLKSILTAPFSEFLDILRPTRNCNGSIMMMVTKDPINELMPSFWYKQNTTTAIYIMKFVWVDERVNDFYRDAIKAP